MASATPKARTLRFQVEGLDCPTCAAKIERAVGRVPGVGGSTVQIGGGALVVETDGTVEVGDLTRASAAIGHPATLLPAPTASAPESALHEWTVEGMDCADCARKIDAAISRLPGVGALAINAGTGRLRLTLDERLTAPGEVVRLVRNLGYTARTASGAIAPPTPWYRTAKGRLVIASGALVALATVLSFGLPAAAPWAYAAATLLAVVPVARKAWAAARAGSPFDINALVSIAALGALFIGEAAEGALVVFLFAVGELLEGVAAGRARHAIGALAAVAPKTALLLSGDTTTEVLADSLAIGDRVLVQPGGRIPADGLVVAGESAVDEAPITGESVPTHKAAGAPVYAGSINTDGALTIAVTHEARDTTLARIITLVTEAEAGKSPTARFIDRFSRWYTPAVFAVTLLVAIIPPLFFAGDWSAWIYKALALLLIGCPCALVLSTPAAVTSAISAGARQGLLIKGGEALEALGKIRFVAFDKTGTLTRGEPRVTDIVTLGESDEVRVLGRAAAVEATSAHPLALAIVAEAQRRGIAHGAAIDGRALPGRAVVGMIAGREVAVGSPRYAAEIGALTPALGTALARLEAEGKTAVVIVDDGRALGVIALRDEPRPDAAAGIAALRALGIESVMLTGDNRRTGQAIATALGLDVQAELLPEDKVAAVAALGARGPIAMVGDGINDAPALATATVGIAMGGGSAVALETADAALLRGAVGGVPALVRLSRATMTNIWQNIGFALGLKALFLVTTLLGITDLWVAVLSDTGATALVTLNALRLLGFQARQLSRHP
ncbi:MAG: Lead, cadmium, zinc and mercury transporting ATPase; Copper-translocating P-type ATPase [uncultured Thermomicrobiales bacterium]|uniref:P-type Zn(2+) transporter n=1 Tax=uncultured Thermomicrobiales bacterium TaxID=1645740 RepID=A0A6J4UL03_9BACT|nr:MAG: Lead, cadmium, zinc and mercury transporting ATPase; Copper-translocating P-type ATPase [uncultured Thermomicrobiales bacterium]